MHQPVSRLLAALSVSVLPLLLFSSLGLGGDFILDDSINILQNRLLYVNSLQLDELIYAALSFHDGNGSRSLPMLSFALDYWRTGSMDAGAFKLTNTFIHTCTVFFLVFFFNRLLLISDCRPEQAWRAALLMALIWGLHPLQVSSVLYIVQRMQTLATLFIVLGLWAYLCMRQAQLQGLRGRGQGVLTILFWLLALLCKEDAVLLIAYTFVLELTVLRFRAGLSVVAKGLRQSYGLILFLGLAGYILIVIPHYWQWQNYYARDFSTPERLLTQGRVLCMYLGQTILPWSDFLPFNYDNYQISRNWWQPWTTLPAILLLLTLLVWAWFWRFRRPLFSCGVLLFFAGHFISSNIIGLELVFEHRNHFPLVGAILAITDLIWSFIYPLSHRARLAITSSILLAITMACGIHLYIWGDTERHTKKMTELNPESSRAWSQLSSVYFKQYNQNKDTAMLQRSIETLQQGMQTAPSPTLAANLITNKSILGTIDLQDWQRYLQLLQEAGPAKAHTISVHLLMKNIENGYIKYSAHILDAAEIIQSKPKTPKIEPLEIATFAYKMKQNEAAHKWFIRYAHEEKPGSPMLSNITNQLESAGHHDLANAMRVINRTKDKP